MQLAEPLYDNSLERDARQYFLIDPEFNSASDLQIHPVIPPKTNWLNAHVWLGWSLWLVTAIFTLRFTQRRFDRWIATVKQYFQQRPWSMLIAFGLLAFALVPSSWCGPGFIAISFYSVVRTYWHEASRGN
jgi:hypothetical protein